MTEQLKLKMNDSKATRWGALVIVAFTMITLFPTRRSSDHRKSVV